MRTGSVSEYLILWGYIIISLGLILSPFFILWKKKLIKWRWIFLAYFLSIAIFIGVFVATNWYDRYLYNNVYNSGWLMDVLLNAGLNQYLIFILALIVSPFFITKIRYGKYTWRRGLLSAICAIIIFAILFGFSLYYMTWALGQVGALYL